MALLKEGDIFNLKHGDSVYYKLPAHFAYANRQGVFDELAKTVLTIGEDKRGMNTDFLLGKYVVIKTSMQGGGTGHGPHDIYQDGHHVKAQKMFGKGIDTIGQPDLIIEFYQTGAFTAMIRDVEVIGKAKFKYEVEEVG